MNMKTAEVWIPLSQGKVTVIDFDDFEKVRSYKWCAQKDRNTFYAVRVVHANGKQTKILLHRVIMNCPSDMEVNHKDGDGLNNKRENFQICTPQQQAFAYRHKRKNASSKYRGVSWFKRDKCWKAQICHNYKNSHIGYFDSEEAAAHAYDVKARELFGEHAQTNLMDIVNAAGQRIRAERRLIVAKYYEGLPPYSEEELMNTPWTGRG